MSAVRVDELAGIVSEHDLEQRAHTAALPIARAALRASAHYRVLAGGGGANEWVRRESAPLAGAMAHGDARRAARRRGPGAAAMTIATDLLGEGPVSAHAGNGRALPRQDHIRG